LDLAEPTVAITSTPDARAPSRAFTRRDLWRVGAVLLVLTAALRLPAFFVDVFNSDETFLATQAQVIREGGNLYEEAVDRKPPLVPYLYAATFAAFGTDALWTVRIAAMLAVAGTAFLLAVEARRRYGPRAGWAAGLLAVAAMVAFAPQDGQAANFEVFMLPAMTASVLLARRGRGVAAGAAVAVATLAKQTGAATLLPVFYLLAKTRGRRGIGESAVGFALPIGLVALTMGPAQLFYWTVLGNGSYIGLKTVSAAVVGGFFVMTVAWALCNAPLLWKVPRAWRDRKQPAADGMADTDLWLWLLSAAVSVAVGLRFFGHYYMQLVPPLCLLSAGALARATRRAETVTVAVAVTAALGFSAAGYFMRPFGSEPDYQTVSKYLAENTDAKDRILVWGNVPEIYWASGRRPATRFPATISLLAAINPGQEYDAKDPPEVDPTVRRWFYEDLRAHPPRYILDTAPAHIRGSQYSPISNFPRFERLLGRHYHYDRVIDGIDIYTRDP
jgi:4-amino-4-deoxy-L-arabinose transferase-like glycosyltransferase